jgi:hypothetical protein
VNPAAGAILPVGQADRKTLSGEDGNYLNTKARIKAELIAPCGMNCAICMGHLLREKNICPGCRGDDKNKPRNCVRCIIVNCEHLQNTQSKYCSEKCDKFPCSRLKDLDKRYRTKYGMSMLENLKNIEDLGIMAFVRNEKTRWTCPECGGLICVHRSNCPTCGKDRQELIT